MDRSNKNARLPHNRSGDPLTPLQRDIRVAHLEQLQANPIFGAAERARTLANVQILNSAHVVQLPVSGDRSQEKNIPMILKPHGVMGYDPHQG
jgi:hypothetical protein